MPIRRVKGITGLPAAVILSVVVAEAAPQGTAGQPAADFLEFLGSWSTGDDHPTWTDPFQLDEAVLLETDQPDERKSKADQRETSKNRRTDDDIAIKQQSPHSVRPGGGVKP